MGARELILVDTGVLEELRQVPGYWYLATVYSKHEGGIQVAFEEACRVAAWMTRRGIGVYCPIAHTHPIAMCGGLDPLDHSIWLPFDKPLMNAAEGLVVVMMKNWEQSYGIGQEVEVFEKLGLPIYHLEWSRPEGEA